MEHEVIIITINLLHLSKPFLMLLFSMKPLAVIALLFARLHSAGALSVRVPQVIHDPEHGFNLFDACSHSTVSTGTWVAVLFTL